MHHIFGNSYLYQSIPIYIYIYIYICSYESLLLCFTMPNCVILWKKVWNNNRNKFMLGQSGL